MSNIVLIGFMGCGKTSVGNLLAARLGYGFTDTDRFIEDSCNRTIKSIFAKEGEAYFRDLETSTIKGFIGKMDQTVLSVGGGLPMKPGNAELLQQLGQVIFLKATRATILIRLAGDTTRPLLSGDNPAKKLEDLFTSRAPVYERAAHMEVNTDGRSFDDIIDEIIKRTGVKP
ncbi:shikimate kinase [Anaerocolumna sp. AGMB13025]|uniref:shikimate kinase n=1 Tax=Anaerocolumna sp. AGMB13025 TaxID=3039116 RepID=UPI00241DB2B4|nr:shikimate kinase [Anaerocolumna sp. AGMB13025]WFR55213.1 shikimate kinase [Anaerocolumna sp. AGMB13025]